ncbi:hypothetical protein C8J56DRAFT_422034 [Mycena floridula]|nr:hypothetical protein C8J56DRAFT_422034 [Mycena floridula]
MPILSLPAALVQKSIINVLSSELMTEIIVLCNSSSQAALCCVSKVFKQLAQRWLYQIVCLDQAQSLNSFHAALSANPQYGAWVRNLAIAGYPTGYRTAGILENTKALRHLSVRWEHAHEWEKLSFAHLGSFSITGYTIIDNSYQSLIPSFLNRHPTISHLAVSFSSAYFPRILRADLPNLIAFQGDPNILGKTPKLRSVRLALTALSDLSILERFPSCQNIRVHVSHHLAGRYHIQDFFRRLPLRQLKSCMLIDCNHNYSSPEFKSIFSNELSRFKQLESFCLITYLGQEGPDDCASTIRSWLENCPSLQEAGLLSSTQDPTGRYKVVDEQLQPTTEPSRMEKIFKRGFGF